MKPRPVAHVDFVAERPCRQVIRRDASVLAGACFPKTLHVDPAPIANRSYPCDSPRLWHVVGTGRYVCDHMGAVVEVAKAVVGVVAMIASLVILLGLEESL